MHGIFKACDVRGVYPEEITEDVVRRIGAAVATLLRRRGQDARVAVTAPAVLVGGDVRASTPSLKAALLDGLAACGAECLDLGTVPTPVFYFARRHLGIAPGVMVTASHNPAAHNGLKIILGGLPVTGQELAEVRILAEEGAEDRASGSVRRASVLSAYRDFILKTAGPHRPAEGTAPSAVVLDPGHGCWAGLAGEVLRALGYQVAAINDTPDGTFAGRDPNPSIPAHLAGLGQSVVRERAAMGIAFDGDGDRVVLVDERGRPVPADAAAMLLVQALVPAEPRSPGASDAPSGSGASDAPSGSGASDAPSGSGASDAPGARVVYDIKCSQALADEVRRCGGVPLMERSGHTFLKTRVIREGAVLGAEASGHYFFRALDGDDDGLYCAVVLAGIVCGAHRSLADWVDALPRYANTPDIRVPYTDDPAPILEGVAAAFPPERVSRLDGVRVQFGEGWGLLRPSVTEPAITLRFEARSQRALAGIMDAFLAPVPELRERVGNKWSVTSDQ